MSDPIREALADTLKDAALLADHLDSGILDRDLVAERIIRGISHAIALLDKPHPDTEAVILRARDRFKHIAADTAPGTVNDGHERVCYNATCGQAELDSALAAIDQARGAA